MAIKSSKFSFVRWNNDWQAACDASDHVLPAFITHEVAFQFEPDGNAAADTEYTIATADADCQLIETLDVTILRLSFKNVLALSQPGGFFVQTITYGAITNDYNVIMTMDEFLDTLAADFGIEAVLDDDGNPVFYTTCELAFSMTATSEDAGAGEAISAVQTQYYGKGYVDLSNIDLGALPDCFRYLIDGSCSNLFKRITDDCFTSYMQYSCNEEAFGFIYPDTPNKIRLPFYLTKPAWPKKREVYRRSTGRNELLSVVVDKIYQIVTDHQPEVFHDCMAIALSHDNVIITNNNIREGVVEVIESDDYAPEWIDEEVIHNAIMMAKGKGKLKVAKYSYANSNCGVGEDPCLQGIPVEPPAPCEPVFTGGVFDDAVVGVPYSSSLELGGTPPFDIYAFTGPSWMSAEISPSNFVHLFGTPDVEAENATINIKLINACSNPTGGSGYTSSINVTLADPANVAITNSQPGTTINNVTGIPGFTFDTGSPIGAGGSQSGTNTGGTFTVFVTFSGVLFFNPGNITWSKNGVPFDCQTVTGSGTFESASVTLNGTTDDITVSLNGGAC